MMEGSSPMEQALRNPIVLQQILQNECIEAKKMRLVCKQWNEIVLTLPEPKLQLNLKAGEKNCCESLPFQVFYSEMEPNLARRVSLSLHCCDDWDHSCSINAPAAKAKLIHICDKFGEFIQFLDLNVEDDMIYKSLGQISYCPNLKGLIIRKCDGELLNPNPVPLPIRRKLVSIYLNFTEQNVAEQSSINTRNNLCQLLINSAPNLNKLELNSESYFPDLSKSENLRILIIPRGPRAERFRFKEFTRMLKLVAEKLEVLRIGCDDSTDEDFPHDFCGADAEARRNFQMPKMPRLKTFTNDYIDTFTCGDALQDLCAERCPSLKSLHLAKNCGEELNLNALLRRMIENKTRLTVTSLTLDGVNDHTDIANLKTSFPHLERLKLINMGIEANVSIQLSPLLKACTSLGLSHLGLELPLYPRTLSEFLAGFLDNLSIFKTLKTFWVNQEGEHPLSYFDEDTLKETPDGWNLMRQFLFIFLGMKRVGIFPRLKKDAWWERVHQFIQENNVPFDIQWCEED